MNISKYPRTPVPIILHDYPSRSKHWTGRIYETSKITMVDLLVVQNRKQCPFDPRRRDVDFETGLPVVLLLLHSIIAI